MHPYIGITDFENREQVVRMRNLLMELSASTPGTSRDLMVGVMMSYKTLKGQKSKWTNVWPPKQEVGYIFTSDSHLLNTLHYADYNNFTTSEDLLTALTFANSHNGLDAVQLDMQWPDPRVILGATHRFRITHNKQLPVILQVGRGAINTWGGDRKKVISKIGSYHDTINGVLLDMSGGKGIPLDTNLLIEYLSEIKNKYPNLLLAVAGGLGPDTMDLIKPIISEFPNISFDAQSKLRRTGKAWDPIDWDLAEKYIRESFALLS